MPKRKSFKCKSEKQKKAIRANYAKKAKKKASLLKSVRLGTTLSTYDEHLPHEKNLKENKKRPVVVIETNERKEMAVVPLSTRKGGNKTHLPNYQQGQSYFKHFVEVEDNEGNPIVLGVKFRANNPKQDISAEDLEKIIRTVLFHSKPAPKNLEKIEKFRNKK